jgi:hypothetical protein
MKEDGEALESDAETHNPNVDDRHVQPENERVAPLSSLRYHKSGITQSGYSDARTFWISRHSMTSPS